MKIATFNINGINTKLLGLLEWLGTEEPDVACLQELKSTDKAFPAAALKEAGYHAMYRGPVPVRRATWITLDLGKRKLTPRKRRRSRRALPTAGGRRART
ncbi:MAG: endonuclease/exonuclease/phosphatase family protein [Deltaproteobacteria bacterium]|nr:endonuclease/exonuclease/phosphatase family protein [Deltaproteobacteria bacterium]